MKVILLGTGAAWPDAKRSGPAFLVQHKNKNYLIDCGPGVGNQLAKAGIKPSTIDHIFFTHIHIDHCVDFPSFVFASYLTGKEGPYLVYGPPGTQKFTKNIFDKVYDFADEMMYSIRKKHIEIDTTEVEGGKVFEDDGLVVETTEVVHSDQKEIRNLAYKFSAEGKSVVFSGDTEPCENLLDLAKGTDLLVIENSFPEDFGVFIGHCIPSQISDVLKQTKAKKVVLVHLFPTCDGKEEKIVEIIQKDYAGEVVIGEDLNVFEI